MLLKISQGIGLFFSYFLRLLKNEQEKINLILNQKEEIIDKELKNYKIQKENIIEKELEDKRNKSIDEYNSYIEKLEISKKDAKHRRENERRRNECRV